MISINWPREISYIRCQQKPKSARHFSHQVLTRSSGRWPPEMELTRPSSPLGRHLRPNPAPFGISTTSCAAKAASQQPQPPQQPRNRHSYAISVAATASRSRFGAAGAAAAASLAAAAASATAAMITAAQMRVRERQEGQENSARHARAHECTWHRGTVHVHLHAMRAACTHCQCICTAACAFQPALGPIERMLPSMT